MIDWDGNGENIRYSDDAVAIKNVELRIQTILEACQAKEAIIAFSCPTRRYWRHDILPDYKATRSGPKPQALGAVIEHVKTKMGIDCRTKPDLEADDILGILGTSPKVLEKYRPIIVTSDKDLGQIPGLHLNHNKLKLGVVGVDLWGADYWHWYQTLVGDTCDNYKGCPGVGPVQTSKLIRPGMDPAEAWTVIVGAFVKKGLTEADALVQARVSRILRFNEWDQTTQRPILWQPPPLIKSPTSSAPRSRSATKSRTPRAKAARVRS